MSCAGRVAQLCNLVSKPELNGVYVVVESRNAETDRYTVKTLTKPNEPVESITMLVKSTSLEFYSSDTFGSRFPDASIIKYCAWDKIPSACILDISTCSPVKPLSITESVSVRGISATYNSNNRLRPASVMVEDVLITNSANDVIEFEDIDFANPSQEKMFFVPGERAITFRRCRFSAPTVGVVIGVVGADSVAQHILFESCLFEHSQCGLGVNKKAKVTLLNCTLSNLGKGICVDEGGCASLLHCNFVDTKESAAQVSDRNSHLELINCNFSNMWEAGAIAQEGGSLVLDGCRLVGCKGKAVIVEGKFLTTAHMEDSVITNCGSGVFLEESCNMDVKLVNTKITKCIMYGLHIPTHSLGHVNLEKSKVQQCERRDIVYLGGVKSFLTIDGVVQGQNDQQERYDELCVQMVKYAKLDFPQHGELMGDSRPTLQQLRSMKKNYKDNGFVKCGKCKKDEPSGETFKECAKCSEVCYCSRECQVAHWKEHKAMCIRK